MSSNSALVTAEVRCRAGARYRVLDPEGYEWSFGSYRPWV
jgi:hypothetical protein